MELSTYLCQALNIEYYFELPKEIKEVLLKSYKIGEKVIVFVNEEKEKRDEKNLQKLCI